MLGVDLDDLIIQGLVWYIWVSVLACVLPRPLVYICLLFSHKPVAPSVTIQMYDLAIKYSYSQWLNLYYIKKKHPDNLLLDM